VTTGACHPTTLVEYYLNTQIAQIPNNTNELAGLELALANVTTTALANAASFIRKVNGTKDLNPSSQKLDQSENLAHFQDVDVTAQKTIQRTKVSWTRQQTPCGL